MRRLSVPGPALAAFVVLLAAVALAGCGSESLRSSTTTSTTTARSTTTTTTIPAPLDAKYLPLFPFANAQAVAAWQRQYRADGTLPEYLDAGKTALAFVAFLGYAEINQVVTTNEDAQGAHVAVGAQNPEGRGLATAAVVHLVRFGTGGGGDVPWEVVGTDDTDFSLTVPVYGAVVGSPMPVGGVISGVDESITVAVQELGAGAALGKTCCIPAGGVGSPWSAAVSFSNPTGGTLIVSAATGGHVRTVERFTVTGARFG